MNIELMEEIKQPKKPKKRSRRSIAWLMEELDMAIVAKLDSLLANHRKIKEVNGSYAPLYHTAMSIAPAYDLIKVRYPELAQALQTILDIK